MNVQVHKNTVVTLEYNVTDLEGELLDAGQEALIYLHGGYDDIFPRIEEALHEKRVGDTVTLKLQPDSAFGEYDASLVQIEPRASFPPGIEVGMQFEGATEDAEEDDFVLYRVTEITGDTVVLDGNHPLAGAALIFTCTITAVRPASTEEIARGHARGANDDEDDDEDAANNSAPVCRRH
ncbi:MAG: peptidylprolyl isomerase [Zoogloeaceae bacterium]|jgi:FKBP-type peptidyl-prolyl cis-trans isomerase SlyD|nr:peptidylprolyl isomerase [Zoogloeaceae bacterium]